MMPKSVVYIVDDEPTLCRLLGHWIGKWGYEYVVFNDGETYLSKLHQTPDLVLLDLRLPRVPGGDPEDNAGLTLLSETKKMYPKVPVMILSAHGTIEVAVDSIKQGAIDYFIKPVDLQKLEITVRNALRTYTLEKEVEQLKDIIASPIHFENIISHDDKMEVVFKMVEKVKDSDIAVLIQGESGTGKELIARALHFNGKRKNGPFVVLNCAAIPKELIESELFGHEKGSFTGAINRKIGKIEQAHGGTLFLDEIGELEINLQAKLLRVLQTKEFDRIGGDKTLTSDVRYVSATHRNLLEAIKLKLFREDLYYRLATFPIFLPPLRERRSDIILLSEYFLSHIVAKEQKTIKGFSKKALKLLFEYPWPGNIRELENAIERAVLLAERDMITEKDLPLTLQALECEQTSSATASMFEASGTIVPLEKIQEDAIRHALKITDGKVSDAAKRLGIGRSTMYNLMTKYKITV